LGPKLSDWFLFLLGAVLFESGHAYRTSHLQHHRVFPGPDDPEGDPARMSFIKAVMWGPVFLPRLWLWAFKRQKTNQRQRRWLMLEAGWALMGPVAAMVAWPWTKALALYVVLVFIGSWVYPLLTVHLPHHHYGDTPLTQTSTLRGKIIPALFLELTYHLEHHLYPSVPSHHLPELAKRMEPVLTAAGVRARRVP
jgi:beta-carotene hydroxylase